MDQPLPLPAPPIIDTDHNGLDDRVERAIGITTRLTEQLLALVARRPGATEPVRRDTLAELLERAKREPARTVGVANPVIELAEGYQFRAVPVKTWCGSAHVPEDVGVTAWVLASEALPVGSWPAYAWAVAEAVQNAARAGHRTITEQVTRDVTHPVAHEHFGRQSGRWCSSFQPPTQQHVELARLALFAREQPLLAGGARRWIDPKVQDQGKQAGKALRFNAIGIVRKWALDGWEWVGPSAGLDGELLLDPYRLMLFRRNISTMPVSVVAAQFAITDGRRRWRVTPTVPDPR